jgi:hypothetical protein
MHWVGKHFALVAIGSLFPLSMVYAHTGPYISSPSSSVELGPVQIPPPLHHHCHEERGKPPTRLCGLSRYKPN